jgi:hypothetical protein
VLTLQADDLGAAALDLALGDALEVEPVLDAGVYPIAVQKSAKSSWISWC